MGMSLLLFSVNHFVIAASVLGYGVGVAFLILPDQLLTLATILSDALNHLERVRDVRPYSFMT